MKNAVAKELSCCFYIPPKDKQTCLPPMKLAAASWIRRNRNTFGDPASCTQCQKDCSYEESFEFCETHKVQKEDAYTGQHFCLEHEQYHCYKHWRLCCAKFGYSVMTARPVTTAHLHKRAHEIIEEQQREIRQMETYIDQMKHARFICAECRCVACICDMSQWKKYDKKRRSDIKNMNNNS